jgi:hypothetical protein
MCPAPKEKIYLPLKSVRQRLLTYPLPLFPAPDSQSPVCRRVSPENHFQKKSSTVIRPSPSAAIMQRVEEDSRMTSYTHHISGRLRIRYPQLKNNPARAKVVETALRKIDGVLSVETSAVTGSLLIRYDARAGKRTALLEKLYHAKQQLGLVPYAPAPAARTSQQRNVAEVLADKALNMIVEKCIERSTYALLAALL